MLLTLMSNLFARFPALSLFSQLRCGFVACLFAFALDPAHLLTILYLTHPLTTDVAQLSTCLPSCKALRVVPCPREIA